jgi:glyoxylate/hydroxypyruvate reductase
MCGGGLVGAKVGIVGLGSIGLAVAKRLLPFEIAKIMYCGRHEKPEGMNSLKSKYHSIIKISFI